MEKFLKGGATMPRLSGLKLTGRGQIFPEMGEGHKDEHRADRQCG